MTTARIRNLVSAALLTGATVGACSVWLGAPASAQGVDFHPELSRLGA